jgi:hypothetical protein
VIDAGIDTGTVQLTDVAGRLHRTEERLERLLADGWRNAGAGLPELEADAEALGAAGADAVAARLRRVLAAGSPAAGLSAVALAACRLLRARLPAPPEAETWATLSAAPAPRSDTRRRLLPVGRLALDDGEAWACVRLHEASFGEWLLLDPPASPTAAGEPRWLRTALEGRLRWRARYPLGASGEVYRFALEPSPETRARTAPVPGLDRFWKALGGGRLADDVSVLGSYGPVRIRRLDPARADEYVWPGAAPHDLFARSGKGEVWALTWQQGALTAPLLLLSPGRLFRRPALVHLVPDLPTTPA